MDNLDKMELASKNDNKKTAAKAPNKVVLLSGIIKKICIKKAVPWDVLEKVSKAIAPLEDDVTGELAENIYNNIIKTSKTFKLTEDTYPLSKDKLVNILSNSNNDPYNINRVIRPIYNLLLKVFEGRVDPISTNLIASPRQCLINADIIPGSVNSVEILVSEPILDGIIVGKVYYRYNCISYTLPKLYTIRVFGFEKVTFMGIDFALRLCILYDYVSMRSYGNRLKSKYSEQSKSNRQDNLAYVDYLGEDLYNIFLDKVKEKSDISSAKNEVKINVEPDHELVMEKTIEEALDISDRALLNEMISRIFKSNFYLDEYLLYFIDQIIGPDVDYYIGDISGKELISSSNCIENKKLDLALFVMNPEKCLIDILNAFNDFCGKVTQYSTYIDYYFIDNTVYMSKSSQEYMSFSQREPIDNYAEFSSINDYNRIVFSLKAINYKLARINIIPNNALNRAFIDSIKLSSKSVTLYDKTFKFVAKPYDLSLSTLDDTYLFKYVKPRDKPSFLL